MLRTREDQKLDLRKRITKKRLDDQSLCPQQKKTEMKRNESTQTRMKLKEEN